MTLEHSEPKPINSSEIARRREVGLHVVGYLSERHPNEFPWIVGHGSFFDPAPYGMTPYPTSDVDIQLRARNKGYRRDSEDDRETWKYINWSDIVDPTDVRRNPSKPGEHFALDSIYLDGVKVDVTPFSYESLTSRLRSATDFLRTGEFSHYRHKTPEGAAHWLLGAVPLNISIVDLDRLFPNAYQITSGLIEKVRPKLAKLCIEIALNDLYHVVSNMPRYGEMENGERDKFEGTMKNALLRARDVLLVSTGYPDTSVTDESLRQEFITVKDRHAYDIQSRVTALKTVITQAHTLASDSLRI